MFTQATGMTVSTFDSFLIQLCPSSNVNSVYRRFLSLQSMKPEIARLYLDPHFEALREAFKRGKKIDYQCHLGLQNTAIPLMAYGRAIGGISAGQVWLSKPNPVNFEILEKYGLDKDELFEVAREITQVTPEKYQQWIELLSTLAASVLRERGQQVEEKKRTRRLEFISELSRHVGDDMHRLLDFIAHAFPEACELEKCTIFFLNEESGTLIAKASNAFGSQELRSFVVPVRNEKGELVLETEPFVSSDAAKDPRLIKEYVEKCQIKSLLTVPLQVREKILGVIHFVNSNEYHYFTLEEISFVNALAAEVSLAIESTFLEEERRARTEEVERFRQEVQGYFSQIGQAITSALDIESLIYLVAELSQKVVKADGCTVHLQREEILEEEIALGTIPSFRKPMTFPLALDPARNSPILETLSSPDAEEVWTSLQIPLMTQEEMSGFLTLYVKGSRTFTSEELNVLLAFAAQAALSIQNIRLFQAEKEKAREMSVVYEAAQAISAPLELDSILSEIGDQMCRLAEVHRSFIFLLDEERKILTAASVHGVTPEQAEFFGALAIPLNLLEGELWQRFKAGRPVALRGEELQEGMASMKHLFSIFGSKSCLLVPLLSEKRLTGLVYLDEPGRSHEFVDPQIRAIVALSIHAATAIERAQLYKELQDQARQVHTLYQISTALSTSLNLDRILQLIIEKTSQLVRAERFCLFMWDDEQNVFVVAASHGLSEDFIRKAIVKIEDRFVGLASYKKKPIYSPNVLLETDNPQLARLFKREGLGAVLAIPLITKRKTIGVITCFAELGYQFKEKEVHLLGNFASHAALSIENARLYNMNKQKVQELGILFDVGKRINEHLNPHEVLRSMAEQFISVMRADGCSIMLLDKDEKTLTIQVTRGIARKSDLQKKIKVGQGIVGKVARTVQSLVTQDQGKEGGEIVFPKALRQEGISTILSVPLATKDQLLGVVNLYNRERRDYTPSEMHLMETLAAQGGVALRNARTFEENYHIAQLIHRSLLPSHVPTARDVEFGFQYLPSQEISGDYYDFLEMRGKIGITIADVSGKGTSAAIFTAQGKYACKAYAMLESDPQKVLELLNRFMVESTPTEKFISLFYGVLDTKKKEFVYSNAGHLPPIVYRAATKQCRYLNVPGLLIGINEDAEFSKRSISLHQGDILLLYTDGVTEARNESREIFGTERLEEILIENATHPAQVIANRVLGTVRQYAHRRNLEDDITVVVVKIK